MAFYSVAFSLAGHAKVKNDTASELRNVLSEAYLTINKKDMAGNIALMHPNAPGYVATLQKNEDDA